MAGKKVKAFKGNSAIPSQNNVSRSYCNRYTLVTNSSYQNPNKPTTTLEDLKQEKTTLLVYCIAQIHPDNTETSLIMTLQHGN